MYTSIQINLSPSIALENTSPSSQFTPHLIGHFHPINPTRLHPFGCLAYVHDDAAPKLAPRARRMIFVGLEHGSNAYRLWEKTHSKIVVLADAKFDETVFPAKDPTFSPFATELTSIFDYGNLASSSPPIDDVADAHEDAIEVITTCPIPSQETISTESLSSPDQTLLTSPSAADQPRRSLRSTTVPTRYGFTASVSENADENPTYEEAISGPDRTKWMEAMNNKWQSFCHHSVGTLVNPPEDANILGGMWVLSRPRDEHHRVFKYKA